MSHDDTDRSPTYDETQRILWTPSEERRTGAALTAYLRWLEQTRGLSFASYSALWSWSVSDLDAFWTSIWEYFEVRSSTPRRRALAERRMPGASWFPGTRLNYAEHACRRRDAALAVIARREDGLRVELTYAELTERVARARAGLRRKGVRTGDRVAALLPNGVEALVAFLACASLGAVWSSSAPEFGSSSVLDRFRQIEPKLLLAVDAYFYGGKAFNRSAELARIAAELPSVQHIVMLTELGQTALDDPRVSSFDELLSVYEPLAFEPVEFDHPLWILYSSGTTGLPKPIVQSHGGILLEHLKALALHCDLGPTDRFFWFSTTGWMMWNFSVSGLLLGATLVLYDGSPAYPDLTALWRLCESERISFFGVSAPYLLACKKAGVVPREVTSLSALRSIGTTGAPLPVDGFEWVYQAVKDDVLLGSISGGTDVCTAFVLCCPLLPVVAGEIQCRGLGAKVLAYDESGAAVVGEMGELVLTEPLPSMPIGFWGDPDGSRYRESYFAEFPGVWRHGDWIEITPTGGAVIYGRSDATLKRGGVRMGTSEFYRVIEALPEIADSLVVDTGSLDEQQGRLLLFVVLRPGQTWSDTLARAIAQAVRSELSPRHVPDEVHPVAAIPRTLNGKKLEVPIKRILNGVAPERALNPGTLQDPSALDPFIALAARLASSGQRSP